MLQVLRLRVVRRPGRFGPFDRLDDALALGGHGPHEQAQQLALGFGPWRFRTIRRSSRKGGVLLVDIAEADRFEHHRMGLTLSAAVTVLAMWSASGPLTSMAVLRYASGIATSICQTRRVNILIQLVSVAELAREILSQLHSGSFHGIFIAGLLNQLPWRRRHRHQAYNPAP
jgi:hypothetical protein